VAGGRSKPDWAYPFFLFAKGLAEYRLGRLDRAISVMEGEATRVGGPNPRFVLAMAQYRRGQRTKARKLLAAAILAFDWSSAQADNPGTWICHVLRREAEALILPNLPAFLQGTYQPQDNDERAALLGVCSEKDTAVNHRGKAVPSSSRHSLHSLRKLPRRLDARRSAAVVSGFFLDMPPNSADN
jgi:serine/threonine-protein kinase